MQQAVTETIQEGQRVYLVQFDALSRRFKVYLNRPDELFRLQAGNPLTWQAGGFHSGDFLTQATDFESAKVEVETQLGFIVLGESAQDAELPI